MTVDIEAVTAALASDPSVVASLRAIKVAEQWGGAGFTADEIGTLMAGQAEAGQICAIAAARQWAEKRMPLEAEAVRADAALADAEQARKDSYERLGIEALEADQAEADRLLREAKVSKSAPLADRVQARQRRLALEQESAEIEARLAEARSQHNPSVIAAVAAEQAATAAHAALDAHDGRAADPLSLPLQSEAAKWWYHRSGLLFDDLAHPSALQREVIMAMLRVSGIGAEIENKIRAMATRKDEHARGLFIGDDGLPLVTAPIGFDASKVPPEPPGGRPTMASAAVDMDGQRALAGLADMGGPVAGALQYGKG